VPTNLTFDRTKQRALPWWLVILTALLIVARIVSTRYPVQKDVDLVRWTPIARASTVARNAHMRIMYEFSADWCGPCHVLEREVFMDPMLASQVNHLFVAVKVIDRQREDGHNEQPVQQLIDRYGVTAFPTVVIVGTDGSVQNRIVGYASAGAFTKSLFRVR
jgi:thiol:disulfide interchange protein